MTEQATGVQDTTIEEAPDAVVDVDIGYRGMIRRGVLLGLFGAALAAIAVLTLTTGTLTPMGASAVLTFMGAMLVYRVFGYRRAGEDAAELVAGHGDGPLPELVRGVLGGGNSLPFSTSPRLKAMIAELARRGRVGLTFRVRPRDGGWAVRPVVVPFEALLLDEAQTGFEAFHSESDLQTGQDPEPPRDPLLRRVKRNVALRGGWLLVAIFAINVVITGVESWTRGRPTRAFMWWLLLLMVMLFASVPGSLSDLRQWFLLPAGMLVRKSRWRGRSWDSHYFVRARSALVICQMNARRWLAVVGDGRRVERLLLTTSEARVLLRGWLSPLPPVPAAQLSDLT